MLVASSPGGPSQPVRGACHWLDDQRAEQCGDLVAGERDLAGWRGMVVLGGGGDGQEGQGEHGQGGPPVPGVPAADLVLVSPVRPSQAWKFSSVVQRIPATLTKMASGTGRGE